MDISFPAAAPLPTRTLCAITGLPAKYVDPVTKEPYATLDAFKQLRERHAAAAAEEAKVSAEQLAERRRLKTSNDLYVTLESTKRSLL